MSFEYKNPNSSVILSGPNSVGIDSNTGTNFSIYQVGGFCEVFSLDDLKFNIPSGSTGTILFSENIIPIDFSYNAPNGAPNVINLYSDGVSSGRRKLGMVAYVYENNKTYQYNIPNYQTLFDNAVVAGSLVDIGTGYQCDDTTLDGRAFVNAWTGSTIEGISGVTRENAKWVEYNPEIYLTGGTYNSGNTILYLYDNVGNTIEVTGFTVSVSGATGSSGTSGTSGAQGSSGQTGSSGTSGSSGGTGSSGASGSSGTSGSAIDELVISGTQNNVNRTFTISEFVDVNNHLFFYNGQLQQYGVDYDILSGTTLVIDSANTPPTPNCILKIYGGVVIGVNGTSGTSGSSGSSGSSGTSGTTGTSGSSGAQGISAGQVYYLNESQNSDVSGYKTLSTTPLATAEQSLVRSVPGNSTGTLVSDYITPELGFSVIPGGAQKFHLHFLKTNQNDKIDVYVEIQLANFSGQTIGPSITSSIALIDWLDGVTPVEENVDITIPTTTIDPTNRMIVRIYLNNQQGSTTNVTFYTEGNSNYSFVLTSVGAIAGSSGTSGTSGSAGTSGTEGTSGTSGSSGTSGTSGSSGSSGTEGTSGSSGSSGTSGGTGSSGATGSSGSSGTSGSPLSELTLSGDKNGVNRIFTTTTTINETNHLFFINGVLMAYNDDYTLSGSQITINSEIIAPDSTDILKLYNSVVFVSGTSGTSGTSSTSGTSGTSSTSGSSGSSGSPLTELALSGDKNGINKVFTTTVTINETNHLFFMNGVLMTYNDDYTLSGSQLTLSAEIIPPESVDILKLYNSVVFVSGTSGTSGIDSTSGTSGGTGSSGASGSSGTSGTSGTGFQTITNSLDNRILTSLGTNDTANAEADLTFDGSILNVNTTSALKIPVGTTAERPISPTVGMIRWSTTISKFEFYDGTVWLGIDGTPTGVALGVATFVVAAGGGGGGVSAGPWGGSGAGGAGGYRTSYDQSGGGASAESTLSIATATNYTVTVGAGGNGATTAYTRGGSGTNSIFSTITSIGGGGGAGSTANGTGTGLSGGSGGGGAYNGGAGGAGTINQGYAGSNSSGPYGGGGGGAGSAGTPGVNPNSGAGVGVASTITGSSVTFSRGGDAQVTGVVNGDANSGYGGSTAYGFAYNGGNGGSGVVIIRYSSSYTLSNPGGGLTFNTISVLNDKVTTFTAGTGNIQFN